MKTWNDYIRQMKKQWVGVKVKFEDHVYTVTDVDYNGALLIDKPAQYTATTAVDTRMVERI